MIFSESIIDFNRSLNFVEDLPAGIRIMNPYRENPHAFEASSAFYRKFYSDSQPRKMIVGINPGRLGAGVTGVPFTDTHRLSEKCGITIDGLITHEPSSVFVYDVVEAYGGTEAFYKDFYITSASPLGFVKRNAKNREVNYNYYDDAALQQAVEPFIVASLEHQLTFGIDRSRCFCLGNNKNFNFLNQLNLKKGYFKEIIPLEHPRFVMQYRSKQKEVYINKYINALRG